MTQTSYRSFITSKCPFSAARYMGQSPTPLYKQLENIMLVKYTHKNICKYKTRNDQ